MLPRATGALRREAPERAATFPDKRSGLFRMVVLSRPTDIQCAVADEFPRTEPSRETSSEGSVQLFGADTRIVRSLATIEALRSQGT
jgi:hypothetical protein